MSESTFFQSGSGAASLATAEYHYNTSNGYGSGSTKIRQITNLLSFVDGSSLLTVSNSATLGFTITVNKNCTISISYFDQFSGASNFGISKNSNQLTTAIFSITADAVIAGTTAPNASQSVGVNVTDYAIVGDVYRPHGSGTSDGSSTTDVRIYIVAQERL